MNDNGPALVTGGTGFLGRRIVERLLDQKRRVTVLARHPALDLQARGVRFVTASVDDSKAVKEACEGASTVFHVAAKVGVWGKSSDFFRVNVAGTRAVIEACRSKGVRTLVYTSTPSVVYTGDNLSGVDESLPRLVACPSPYPTTKAVAEEEVLAANDSSLRTVALRPHLVWGPGDRNLIPRVVARARSGRLRIVGDGTNRVDMVHVENAADAHMLAEERLVGDNPACEGKAYFITNGEPVVLWDWINDLLKRLGEKPVTKKVGLRSAIGIGILSEVVYHVLPLSGEPPMTRFIAAELAKDHWFDIGAAKRDLGYAPKVSMEEGMDGLVTWLKSGGANTWPGGAWGGT